MLHSSHFSNQHYEETSLYLQSGKMFTLTASAKYCTSYLTSWQTIVSLHRSHQSSKSSSRPLAECWILFYFQAQAVALVSRRSLKCQGLQCRVSAIWLVPLQDHLLGHSSSVPVKVSASQDLFQSCQGRQTKPIDFQPAGRGPTLEFRPAGLRVSKIIFISTVRVLFSIFAFNWRVLFVSFKCWIKLECTPTLS